MDSVTQIAFGAAVGGAAIGRRAGWRAFAWGALVGTLPDLDSFVSYGGPVADFTYHRGYTHALLVQTLAAPLIAWPIRRLHPRCSAGYGHWLLAAWLVLVTHALLDAFTIYGTQLLLPFSDYPVGLGSVFIIDPLFTLPLVVGVIGALRWRHGWEHARRWNGAGLALAGAYLAWTVVAQQWVEARAARAIADRDLPVERMLATPAPLNSVLWRIVVVGEDAHWEGYYTIGSGRAIRFHRYDTDPALLRGVDDRWAVQRLQRFTKGFYAVNERDGAVVITDLRMGVAGFYAFAFEVAERVDGRSVARPDGRHAYPRPPLRAVVPEVLACALGRPTRFIRCR